jgi:hypothetical protein
VRAFREWGLWLSSAAAGANGREDSLGGVSAAAGFLVTPYLGGEDIGSDFNRRKKMWTGMTRKSKIFNDSLGIKYHKKAHSKHGFESVLRHSEEYEFGVQ